MRTFDPGRYTSAPLVNLAGALALGVSLVEACPGNAPESVLRSCKKLGRRVKDGKAAWAERQKQDNTITEDGSRVLDLEADTSWGALRTRLESYATLPEERFPLAPRAAELIFVLFGKEGLEFLKLPYDEQWQVMDVILIRIGSEGLAEDIDAIAGPDFLKQIRHVHKRYTAMAKEIKRRMDDPSESLAEHLRGLQRAIVEYATRVCATVEEDELETVDAALAALRPIDQVREAQAPRAAATRAAREAAAVAEGGEEAGEAEEAPAPAKRGKAAKAAGQAEPAEGSK